MDAKRREEIEQKRARLRQLRQQRQQRESIRHSIGNLTQAQPASTATSNLTNTRQELDSLITSLVGDSRPISSTDQTSPGSHSRPLSVSSGLDAATGFTQAGPAARTVRLSVATQTEDLATRSSANSGTDRHSAVVAVERSLQTTVPKRVMYTKGVQTSEEFAPYTRDDADDDDSVAQLSPISKRRHNRLQREKEEKMREAMRAEIEEELRAVFDKSSAPEGTLAGDLNKPTFLSRDLSEEEVNAITASDEFMDFIDRSTKVIERALDQEYDILVDYALAGDQDASDDEDGLGAPKGRRIKEVGHFWDSRWSAKRMISDMSFSPKYPELVVASYTKNPSAPHDPDGIVQVWNLHMHDRPEYVFHAQSDILTVKFSPYHSHLILGGCYSGQVLVWDTRSRSPAPVQKTPLTGVGHAHPVYSLDVVGTQNANNIISASTDGVVCSWAVDMLSQPQEFLELTNPKGTKTDEFAPTCIAFPASDPTYFLAGSEEGIIVPCHRYDRAGAKAGIDPRISYRGHTAPITSLNFHPAHGPVDLGDLVLSSSLDWSVQLWKVRPPAAIAGTGAGLHATSRAGISASSILGVSGMGSSSSVAQGSGAGGGAVSSQSGGPGADQAPRPLLEIAREDLIYDVKWSPTRPAVFGLVDGAGHLELWDLNFDTEVPAVRVKPGQLRRNRNVNLFTQADPIRASGIGGGASHHYHHHHQYTNGTPSTSAGPGIGAGGGSTSGPTSTIPAPLPPGVSSSLNRLAWEPSEGRRIAVGGLDGVLSVFEVGNLLGGTDGQKADEWAGMKRLVSRAEQGFQR